MRSWLMDVYFAGEQALLNTVAMAICISQGPFKRNCNDLAHMNYSHRPRQKITVINSGAWARCKKLDSISRRKIGDRMERKLDSLIS